MRLVRPVILGRDDLLRCSDHPERIAADLPADLPGPFHELAGFAHLRVGADLHGWTEFPLDRQQLERGLGPIPRIRDHRDAVLHVRKRGFARHGLELDRGDEAWSIPDRRRVETLQFPPGHRATLDRSVHHAGQARVDRERCTAIDLRRYVESLRRIAQQPPLIRCLDRRLLCKRDLCGGCRELSVGRRTPPRAEHADFRFDCGPLDTPCLRRRLLQTFACRSPGLHDVGVLQSHEHRAVRAHHLVLIVIAQVPVRIGEHGLHFRPCDVQLLGDHHRDRRKRTLTHFRVRHADGHAAFAVDREPRVDLDSVGRRLPWLRLDSRREERPEYGNRAACRRRLRARFE